MRGANHLLVTVLSFPASSASAFKLRPTVLTHKFVHNHKIYLRSVTDPTYEYLTC